MSCTSSVRYRRFSGVAAGSMTSRSVNAVASRAERMKGLLNCMAQRTPTPLLNTRAGVRLDWADDDHHSLEVATLPQGYDGFMVNAAFVRIPSFGRQRLGAQHLTDAPTSIERLHRLAKQCSWCKTSEASICSLGCVCAAAKDGPRAISRLAKTMM